METVLASASVPEHLKCPICCEVPLDKVFQCKDGHVICETCLGKLSPKLCPQCRVELGHGEIRNRHIEGMLDKLRFPCPFAEKGCRKRLGRREIQIHAKTCQSDYAMRKFKEKGSVRICELLGYPNCDFRMGKNLISEAILHLQLRHNHNLVWLPHFPENFETIEEQLMWVMGNPGGKEAN